MRYLYGDSSSFPLNENFIETLAAATDCSVALLQIDEKLHKARHTAQQVNEAATKELADIDRMFHRLESALVDDELSKATSKVVDEVKGSAKAHFDRARAGIKSWRASTIHKAERGTGPSDVMSPLNRFFVRHELPYTAWGLRWRSGHGDDPVQAQVYAVMQRGLTATMAVAIPEKHLWSQPVRMMQLEKKLSIEMMGKNWLGKEKMREEPLEKLYVTKVTRTSDRHAFEISKKPKEPSTGFRFVMREAGKKQPTVQRLGADGQPEGDPIVLTQLDGLKLKKVWRQIEASIADLVFHRAQLLASTFHGKRVTELPSPIKVAMVIIQSVAPLVRDMASHSRTPGELQLKRDLGDGRREELFISASEIVKKYSVLTSRSRELFMSFGLEPGRPASFDLATSYSSIPAPMLAASHSSIPAPQLGAPPAQARSSAPPALPRVVTSTFPPPPPTRAQSSQPPRHSSDPVPALDVSAELVPPPPALPSDMVAPPQSQLVRRPATSAPPPPRRCALPSPAPQREVSASGFRLPPPTVPPPARRSRNNMRAVNG